MSIQSYITARPVMGYDPAGYVPFVAPSEEYYVTNHVLQREFQEDNFFVITSDVSQNQLDFLDALQLELDTNYAATSFTDASRDYLIDYRVSKVERVFVAPTTSIWEQRTYVWKITINVKVNTNA